MLIEFRVGIKTGGNWSYIIRLTETVIIGCQGSGVRRGKLLDDGFGYTLHFNLGEWSRVMMMMALINQSGDFGDQRLIYIPFEPPPSGG